MTDSWQRTAERAGALVLGLEANAEPRIAVISRRGPLPPAAMAFLDDALTEPR